jgi:hypothetical protein
VPSQTTGELSGVVTCGVTQTVEQVRGLVVTSLKLAVVLEDGARIADLISVSRERMLTVTLNIIGTLLPAGSVKPRCRRPQ